MRRAVLVTNLESDIVAEVIARYFEICVRSEDGRLLLLWTKDGNQCFLPLLEKGLRLRQESVEFTDSDDGLMTLPFSRLARVVIDKKKI